MRRTAAKGLGVLLVLTASAAGAAAATPPRHTNAELAVIVAGAITAEKKALAAFDAGRKAETKKELEKSLSGLGNALGSTSGTTAGDLRQAITKDNLAIESLPGNRKERVRSLINHAIVNKQFALDAITPRTTPPPPKPPDVAIHASFDEEESGTVYSVDGTVYGVDASSYPLHASSYPLHATLAYQWTLAPPTVDPACNNLGKTTSTEPEFFWRHGPGPPPYDTNPGGCDHSKEGPQGHQGTVKVVLSVGSWKCKATYSGTNTGRSAKATCKLGR